MRDEDWRLQGSVTQGRHHGCDLTGKMEGWMTFGVRRRIAVLRVGWGERCETEVRRVTSVDVVPWGERGWRILPSMPGHITGHTCFVETVLVDSSIQLYESCNRLLPLLSL